MAALNTPIQHVVVLMLENRSFDHLFGFMPGVDGLKGTECNYAVPGDASSAKFTVGQRAPFAISQGEGPAHSVNATNKQLSGNKAGPGPGRPADNSGFVSGYIDALASDHVAQPDDKTIGVVLQSFAPGSLPSLEALAKNFVLCDRWFAEVPGPTQANRLFTHAATSGGYAHNVWAKTFDVPTIYNRLEDAGLSWAVYFSDDNDVAKFSQLRAKAYSRSEQQPQWEADRAAGALGAFFTYEEFFVQHARAGTLPHYTFIEPNFGDGGATSPLGVTSMHAPHDVRGGDRLVKQVYEAIRANEALWQSTLLIVTFDEHGGFFDHVVPPAASNPDGLTSPQPDDPHFAPSFAFDRLGLRVPTILASPLLPAGKIVSKPLQHTSILSTLTKMFKLGKPLTRRDAEAPTFDDLLLAAGARHRDTPMTLPGLGPSAPGPALDSAAHLSNQKPDGLLAEKLDGWHRITRDLPDGQLGSDSKPQTHAHAHEFMRDQVVRYANFRHAQAGPSAPRSSPLLPPSPVGAVAPPGA